MKTRTYIKPLILFILFLVLCFRVNASKRYWISSVTASWNSTANWSSSSGGSSGASVPGSNDTCYFDGNGLGRCDINANVNVKRFEIVNTYTDTITQNAYTVTVGSGHMVLANGIFLGSASKIFINGHYNNSACYFKSTSDTLQVIGDFTLTGTGSYAHNNGTLSLNYNASFTTNTLTCSTSSSTKQLYHFWVNSSSTKTLNIGSGNIFTVNGNFSMTGAGRILISTGTIEAKGNLIISNINNSTGGTNTGTILINGSGNQSLTGAGYDDSFLPNVTINKSATDTLFLYQVINLNANWTRTSGVVIPGSGTLYFSGAGTITGNQTLRKLQFGSGVFTIASGTVLTVTDSLVTSSAASALVLNTGTIEAKGNIDLYNLNLASGGTATILINGTSNQKMESHTNINLGRLCNLEINKSSGTLKLRGIITAAKDWTYSGGTLNTDSSTVLFDDAKTISGTHALNKVILGDGSLTVASGTILTVNDSLSTMVTNSLLTINTGTIAAKGGITIQNTSTSTSGGGTGTILINGTGNQTLTGSGIAGAGYLPKVNIDKPSGTLYLASITSMNNDWTYTAGTVDASTYNSTVYVRGSKNIDGQGTSSTMSFHNLTVNSGTVTATGDLKVSNNLTISSSTTLAQGSYGLSFGSYTNNGTHTSSGAVSFVGNGYHTFSKSGGGTTSFANVTINRTGGSLMLASPVTITSALTLSKGKIKTTATNILNIANNATVTGGSDSAYVHGPVIKTGDDAFTFPLGDTSITGAGSYHPLTITAPSSATDAFTASYNASAQTSGSARDTMAIDSISTCEYWTVARTTGTSLVKVGVDWNTGRCQVPADPDNVRLANWNGTKWISVGDVVSGTTLTSNNTLNAFGTFTIGQNACSVLQLTSPVKVNGTVTHKTDGSTNDGSIALNVSGTTSPYTYSWSSGPTTSSITGLSAGIYTVTVTDAYACQVKKYYFIGSKGSSTTYTLTPDGLAGKDAMIQLSDIGPTWGNTNYANYGAFRAAHTDVDGSYFRSRSFLAFDFSSLPYGTEVTAATLHLYGTGSNQFASDNAAVLKRVANKWEEKKLSWNNQPYTYDSDAIALASTTNTSEDYSPDVLTHVKKMVANAYGNNGWMIQLANEASASQAALHFASSDHGTSGLRPSLVITLTIQEDCDLDKNWVQTTTFGEEGEITSQSKSFMDNLGRSTQNQARVLSTGVILASETMYDGFGRPVGSTLPAPTYASNLCYKNNFLLDATGAKYDYNDYDNPATTNNYTTEVNNPNPVGTQTATVGWYYSNSNTDEPFVAATSYPYSRVEYSNDPTGTVRRVGGVDTLFRMGSGHETKSFIMPGAGELDYIYGAKGTYNLAEDLTDVGQYKSENLLVYKTLSINADGKEAISYTNSAGQLIASCVSGTTELCTSQNVVQAIRYIGNGYTTLHIPKSKNSSLKFPVACAVCPANSYFNLNNNTSFSYMAGDAGSDIRIYYKLQNAETNEFLEEGTDYTFNRSTRAVSFTGDYANKSLVLNVAYDIPAAQKSSMFFASTPELAASYTLDYNQWSFNYYDLKGRLISSVSPNDVNCSDYFQGSESHVEMVTTNLYSGGGLTIEPSDYADPGAQQNLVFTMYSTYEDPLINARHIAPDTNVTTTYRRPLTAASFATFADSTAVIDSTAYASLASEWDSSNVKEALVPMYYSPLLEVLDSIGNPVDTIVDTLAMRIALADKYYEIHAEFDLALDDGAGLVNQGQEQEVIFKWYHATNEGPVFTANSTVSYQLGTDALDTLQRVNINLVSQKIHFYGYSGVDPNTGYYLVYSLKPSFINADTWFNIVYTYSMRTMLHFKGVFTNSTIQVAQTPTTKISYDKYNRVVQTISQDEGQGDVIYDEEGKVRFTQNDLQRSGVSYGGRFSYVNYDKRGRPTESGEYNPAITNTGVDRMYFQTQAQYDANTNNAPSGSSSVMNILNSSDGLDNTRSKFVTYTAYDFADTGISAVSGASPAYTQTNTHGRVSKAWNDKGTTWYSYDEHGMLNWTVQDITGLGVKTYNYVTGIFGTLQQTQYQKENTSERLFHKYEYDADSRLVNSYASTDGGSTWNALTKNQYYMHGPLKRMELGNGLQGLDYVYTINGALKSINDPYLTSADPGGDSYSGTHSGINKDVFGYSIDYYPGDYKRDSTGIQHYEGSNFGGDNDSYAGIIKAVRWQTQLPSGATNNYSGKTLMYEYKYDFNYQLTDALFTPVVHNSGSVPSNTVQPTTHHNPGHGDYSNAYATGNITYDLNGNIQTLQRNPYVALDAGVSPHDDLTYHYDTTRKNRLLYVDDAAGTATGTETDFPDQASANYTYDVIGQLIGDNESDLEYEYYPDGLVRYVRNKTTHFSKASFEYNHLGLRQRKITYDGSGEPLSYTWYVYDPGGALVSTYTTSVGGGTTAQEDLPLYAGGRVGMLNKTTGRYAFELTDHLGNVRSVIADNSGAVEVLSYSDFYPHGGVLPGRNYVSSPSYKFNGVQGNEKDAETNFTNFELRQLDPRLGRWFNPDPMGQYYSPYLAMGNNPVSMIDPTGGSSIMGGLYGDLSLDNYIAGMDYYERPSDHWASFTPSDRGIIQGLNHTSYGWQNTDRILDVAYTGGSYIFRNGSKLAINSNGQAEVLSEQLINSWEPETSNEGVGFNGLMLQSNVKWVVAGVISGADNWKPMGELSMKDKMRRAGPLAYYMHGVANGLYDAGEAAVLFGARDMFKPETWKNMDKLLTSLSVIGVANGDFKNIADGVMKKIRDGDVYDLGHVEGVVGFGILADKGLGFVSESAEVSLVAENLIAKTPLPKVLKGSGGKVNGFSISKGTGYGAKSRFDVHKLTNPSKRSNRFPNWVKDKTLPHYHRGLGNSLHRHRPWEISPNDKSWRDRF